MVVASDRSPKTLDEARARLVAALDLPDADAALALAERLEGHVGMMKVGLELFCSEGPGVVRALRERGHEVFLDLKLADIPATVAGAARAVAGLGVRLLTVNAPPSSVRAAKEALAGSDTLLLGITLLTSIDDAEARAWCDTEATPATLVTHRADMLIDAGCDGLVCSPREAGALRARFPDTLLITPGVRLVTQGAPPLQDDQARTATPARAAADGADHLVVGRAIRDADDPVAAADAIADDAWSGFRSRTS